MSIPESVLVSRREISAWIDSVVKGGAPKENASTTEPRAVKSRKGTAGAGETGGAAPAAKGKKSAKAAAASGGSIGPCPSCGKDVHEFEKCYSCTGRCGFVLWKNRLSRWGKDITPSLASRLLKGRPVQLRALVSAKEGNKFDAHGQLHNDPQYGWSVRLIFSDNSR